jgi:hypothetical protein
MRNFQPRVSIAWRPFNDTKTVIRAGFGIFTMTNLGPLSFNNSGNPTSALHTYSNCLSTAGVCNSSGATGGVPLIQFPNTAPPTVGVQYGGGGLDQGVDPNYRDPQANQWNLTVERQLASNDSLRVSYVGMRSYRLSVTEDLNQIPASTTPYQTTAASPYVDPRAPYHNWFTLYGTFNAGEANYNALQVEENHKMSHGLYFSANYTLAKNLANNQGDTPTAYASEVNYGIPIANRFDVHSDYGNVEGTRHNRFLLTGLYQLPVGEGRTFLNTGGWRNAVLGGWELTTITLLETGPWLTRQASATRSISPIRTSSTVALSCVPTRFRRISIRVSRARSTSISQHSRLLLPVPDALATRVLVFCRAPAQSRPASASLRCFALPRQSECASSPRLPTCLTTLTSLLRQRRSMFRRRLAC